MKRLLKLVLVLPALCQAGCNHTSREDREQSSLIRAGDRMHAAGDASSAINIYKSALDKNPPHKLPLYLKLGESYMNAGQLDEARKVYEEALPLDENDEVKRQLARLYISTGQPDAAISILEGILLAHKDDVMTLNVLGVAHDIKGEHQIAQESYQKALIIHGENDEVKSNLGLSLALSGQYEEALKWLQPIGERLGATSRQRHNLALAYALSGDHAKAEDLYAKDMGKSDIHKNLHALKMIPKPPSSDLKVSELEAVAE